LPNFAASRITALTNNALERSLEVVRQGNDGILVQMPGAADPGSIRKLLGPTAKMTFHWVAKGKNEANPAGAVSQSSSSPTPRK
jgi:SecD/SecF fusion protein